MEFVAAPDRRRHLGHKLEQPPSTVGVVAQPTRAFDSLGDVRDNPVTPAPNLVAEQPKATRRSCPDWTHGDDAALAALAPGGRLLDDETSLWEAYLECRVVEVAAVAVLEPRRDPSKIRPLRRTEWPPAPSGSQ